MKIGHAGKITSTVWMSLFELISFRKMYGLDGVPAYCSAPKVWRTASVVIRA